VEALHKDWVYFGDISFRPESGHAKRGEHSYYFPPNTKGYKILQGLMRNPNKKFHVDQIMKDFLGESAIDKNQARRIVHDAIHKQIRPKLGVTGKNNRVDILSRDSYYTLTAIPTS
jgi:DNA-binding response OmpR family regulator